MGRFGDECFQAIDCTDTTTHNQEKIQKTQITPRQIDKLVVTKHATKYNVKLKLDFLIKSRSNCLYEFVCYLVQLYNCGTPYSREQLR